MPLASQLEAFINSEFIYANSLADVIRDPILLVAENDKDEAGLSTLVNIMKGLDVCLRVYDLSRLYRRRNRRIGNFGEGA
jgi:hypothetical protein